MFAVSRHAAAAPQRMIRQRSALKRAAPTLAGLGASWWLLSCFVGHSLRPSGRDLVTGRRLFFTKPTGRDTPINNAPPPDRKHFMKGTSMYPPWPQGMEEAMFGMGCFWCSENIYMRLEGVYSTQVGYAGGDIKNPSYEEVCTGMSGHNEVVRVIYDPKVISYGELLKIFWERHDPTTLNQQGNDRGTQYRSGIYYYTEEQREVAEKSKAVYEESLKAKTGRSIVTEIVPAPEFYYAEDYHQQYDGKPGTRQYCGLRPTGVDFDTAALEKAAA